jgi:hypothetical protein
MAQHIYIYTYIHTYIILYIYIPLYPHFQYPNDILVVGEPQRSPAFTVRLLGTVGEPINPEAWRWYYRVVGARARRSSCVLEEDG